jgi:hypothetical protein
MAKDALGKSAFAYSISTGDDDWTVDGDNYTKSVTWKSGNKGSVGVVFKPGTDEVVVCEINN